MSGLPDEELVLRVEQLRNADKDIDEPFRCRHFEKLGKRITENRAAQRMFDDNDSASAGKRWDLLKSFLVCPARDLWDEGLEFLIELLEKKSMSAHYVSSFLRIIESGIWYDLSADYMRAHIVSKWEGSLAKNSWAQQQGKGASEKNVKKGLKPGLSDLGKKSPEHKKKERDLRGRFTRHRKKDTDLGQI